MCTIIALHRLHPQLPLVVAANRDEFLARPASGPRRLLEDPPAMGGLDDERGGSWMGATAGGLFVGLTNQRPTAPTGPGLRSRGEVVVEALRSGSVGGTRRLLRALDPADFNAFNLLYGDGHSMEAAYVRPDTGLQIEPLQPGLHVLANDRLGSPAFPKAQRARELVEPLSREPWQRLVPGLAAALADHELPPEDSLPPLAAGLPLTPELQRALQALCIHLPSYGTRSATILALRPGALLHYLYAPGPPCSTSFEGVSGILRSAAGPTAPGRSAS